MGGYVWIIYFSGRALFGEAIIISIITCITTRFVVRPGWFDVFLLDCEKHGSITNWSKERVHHAPDWKKSKGRFEKAMARRIDVCSC